MPRPGGEIEKATSRSASRAAAIVLAAPDALAQVVASPSGAEGREGAGGKGRADAAARAARSGSGAQAVVLASDVSALYDGAASAKLRGHVLGEKEAAAFGDRAAGVTSRETRRVGAGFAGLAALAGARRPRRAALGAATGRRGSAAGVGLTCRLGLTVVSTTFCTAATAAAGALVAAATTF